MSKRTRLEALDDATSKRLAKMPQRDTTPEKLVRTILTTLGHSYRKNLSTLPGSPDLANRSKKWAIFVHGCYWHHHEGCSRATIPKNNRDFWVEKFQKNRERDARKVSELEALGLNVLTIWECETRKVDELTERIEVFVTKMLTSSDNST